MQAMKQILPTRLNVISKFLVVGGLSTLIQFIFLSLFIEFNVFSNVVASASSYLLSSVFNYVASYFYTFNTKVEHHHAVLKYICMNVIGVSVNTFMFYVFDCYVFESYFYAQIFAIAVVVLINFVLSKFWVFR